MNNNNNSNNVRATNIRLSTVATSTRQTPKTDFGSVMRAGLVKAGNVAVEGLRVAAPFVPGGAIVSAALAGANAAAGMPGPQYAAPVGGGGSSAMGGGFGSSSHALTGATGPTATGTGASIGGATTSGSLAIPGRRPGLGATTGTPASSFAGGGGANAGQAGSSDAFNQMMTATREMSEFQASFNLQYLQLQEKIQTDTRQFNLISNIMKTKHDAAKNALNNVR